MDDELPDLSTLTDIEIIKLYQAKKAGDPGIARLADALAARGIDPRPEPT